MAKEQITTHGSDNATGNLIKYVVPVAGLTIGLGVFYWLYQTIAALKAQNEALKKENETLQTKIVEQNKAKEIADKLIEKIQADFLGAQKDLGSQKEDSQQKTQEYDKELSRLVKELSESAGQNALLKKEITQTGLLNQSLQEKIKVLEKDSQQKIEKYGLENKQLLQELTQSNERKVYFEETSKTYKKNIDAMLEQRSEQIEEKKQISEKYQNLQKEYENFKRSTENDTKNLTQKVNSLITINENLVKQLDKQAEDHQKELSKLQQENVKQPLSERVTPTSLPRISENQAYQRNSIYSRSPSPASSTNPLWPLEGEKLQMVKKLVETEKKSETSQDEKYLVRLLIFQILLHKNNKTIRDIIIDIKEKILAGKLGISEENLTKKFPIIMPMLSEFQNTEDAITKLPLTLEELKNSRDLLSGGKFLPEDNTGYSVFAKLYDKTNVEAYIPKKDVTEDDYISNFVTKIQRSSNPGGKVSRSNSLINHS